MLRSRKSFLVSTLLSLAVLLPAGPVIAADGAPNFIWPTTGRITQPYGCTGFRLEPRYGSCRHFHGGIDIANSRGTPIRAAADGVIRHVGWDPWGMRNWMVMIKHGNGFVTWYAHMRAKRIDGISKGVRVRRGELIGYMDTTGRSTGPHLHWAVLKKGRYVNPRDYVEGTPQRKGQEVTTPSRTSCASPWTTTVAGAVTALVLEADYASRGAPASCAA